MFKDLFKDECSEIKETECKLRNLNVSLECAKEWKMQAKNITEVRDMEEVLRVINEKINYFNKKLEELKIIKQRNKQSFLSSNNLFFH